jgi:hypothetical protein
MKPAEEWHNKLRDEECGYVPPCLIKQIQLDALKEGMLRAAKLAGARPNTLTMWEVEKFIISAANQLKTP